MDSVKKFYLLKIKGFDPSQMAACTLFFEGSKDTVKRQEENTYRLAEKWGGMNAGEESGIRAYWMTFAICYLRDMTIPYKFVSESIETCCPWNKVSALCRNTGNRIREYGKTLGIDDRYMMVGWRVTQLYASGAAIYLYYGFNG
jgi:alkyldihydroxyacetonephosphate synthase